jgi:hypothetical protein
VHPTTRLPATVIAVVSVVITGAGLGACSRDSARNATPAEFCRVVKQEDARLADLAGSRDAVAKAAVTQKALVDSAPIEIRDDVDLLADGYEKAADGDFVGLASRMGRLEAAAKHVVRYTQATCDFDLNAR